MDKYITTTKENFYREILSLLFRVLLIFTASFIVSYIFFKLFHSENAYLLTAPYNSSGGAVDFLKSVAESLLPYTIFLLLIFLSVFSSVGNILTAVLGIWRGFGLGCFISLYSAEALHGISVSGAFIASLYFLSSILLIVLSSYTSVYAKVVSIRFVSGVKTNLLLPNTDFLHNYLIISGLIYLTSAISFIII